MVWSEYFHYRKIVSGAIINTLLASSVVLKGFIFIMSGYDSCGEKHKVGIELIAFLLRSY